MAPRLWTFNGRVHGWFLRPDEIADCTKTEVACRLIERQSWAG